VNRVLLINLFGCIVVISGVLLVTVPSGGILFMAACCKVGDIFNLKRGKVGVGKSSHGGIRVCSLSGLSFSVGIATGNNVGLVFSSTGGVD
jgi:hypothetical protein